MLSAILGVHGYFKLSVEYPVCTKIASNAIETCQYEIEGQYAGSKSFGKKILFIFGHNFLQTGIKQLTPETTYAKTYVKTQI